MSVATDTMTTDEVLDAPSLASDVPASHDTFVPYLFSLDGAADYVSVSRRTIEYAVANGSLKSLKLGRNRKVRRADLEAWVDAQAALDS